LSPHTVGEGTDRTQKWHLEGWHANDGDENVKTRRELPCICLDPWVLETQAKRLASSTMTNESWQQGNMFSVDVQRPTSLLLWCAIICGLATRAWISAMTPPAQHTNIQELP
jgi:hypothetical protein